MRRFQSKGSVKFSSAGPAKPAYFAGPWPGENFTVLRCYWCRCRCFIRCWPIQTGVSRFVPSGVSPGEFRTLVRKYRTGSRARTRNREFSTRPTRARLRSAYFFRDRMQRPQARSCRGAVIGVFGTKTFPDRTLRPKAESCRRSFSLCVQAVALRRLFPRRERKRSTIHVAEKAISGGSGQSPATQTPASGGPLMRTLAAARTGNNCLTMRNTVL